MAKCNQMTPLLVKGLTDCLEKWSPNCPTVCRLGRYTLLYHSIVVTVLEVVKAV